MRVPPSNSTGYFAALESAEELGRKILSKVDDYGTAKLTSGIHQRQALAYQYYFGQSPEGVHATSQVLRAGEQGELAAIRVNHSRPLVNTLLNLIVAPKLVWQPKATNIDYDSVRECDLAAAVLEYYWKEARVSQHCVRALEEALVFTEGFVFAKWQDDAGEAYTVELAPEAVQNPDTSAQSAAGLDATLGAMAGPVGAESENPPAAPIPGADLFEGAKEVKSGDIYFCNVSAWDVIRDPNATSWEALNWVIVRKWVNRWDLAAKFPEQAEAIQNAPAEISSQNASKGVERVSDKDSDDVPVYLFFHKRTPAVKAGRQAMVLADGTVLGQATELKYRDIPLYRVSAGEMFGTPFGYTPYLDVLGIQELMDSLHTSVASNQSTLATQLIAVPIGEDTVVDDIAGGMKVIYFDPTLGPQAVPQGINLTKTPPEVFQYMGELKKHQELIFGLNSVVRGEAQSGEMSGSALALLQSQALQQSSTIQANWLRMVEQIGTGVIDMIRDNASIPHKIALAGKSSAALLPEEEISKDSFKRIRRVHVEIGNPMSQTSAGRAEMAKDMMNLGLVRTPEQYQEVLSTGQLRMLTEGMHHELLLIRGENEELSKGEVPVVADLDNHPLHVQEHKSVLANPQVRKNPKLIQAVLTHIQEHQVAFHTTDPTLLMMAGMQPPMPLGGPPPGSEMPPDEGGANDQGTPPGDPAMPPGNPTAGGLPNAPKPPQNPSTGADWNPIDGGSVPGRGLPA